MTGFPMLLRITRGVYVFIKFIWNSNILLFFAGFLVFVKRRTKEILLLLVLFLFQSLYSIYVGGDAWEQFGGSNRFLSVVMPCYFILFSISLSYVHQKLLDFNLSWPLSKLINFKNLILFSLIIFNSTIGPEVLVEVTLIFPPRYKNYNKNWTEIGTSIDRVTTKNAKIAVVLAGTMPYFSDRYYIDLLGKNDKYIAHLKAKAPKDLPLPIAFYPGHMKYDYQYSIDKLKPDVITDAWGNKKEALRLIKQNHYIKQKLNKKYWLWFLKGSKNILWDKINYPLLNNID